MSSCITLFNFKKNSYSPYRRHYKTPFFHIIHGITFDLHLFLNRKFGWLLEEPGFKETIYFELVYLVTAFVPSETACLANSPGNKRRTAV